MVIWKERPAISKPFLTLFQGWPIALPSNYLTNYWLIRGAPFLKYKLVNLDFLWISHIIEAFQWSGGGVWVWRNNNGAGSSSVVWVFFCPACWFYECWALPISFWMTTIPAPEQIVRCAIPSARARTFCLATMDWQDRPWHWSSAAFYFTVLFYFEGIADPGIPLSPSRLNYWTKTGRTVSR